MAKLLLVDDDNDLTTSLQAELQKSGWAVECADCVADAKQILHNFQFDMIILDWDLPDGTGIEICAWFREQGKATPIIFLTGNDEIASLENAFDLGADDYITKPFEVRELLARIRGAQRRASGLVTPKLIIGDARLDKQTRRLFLNESAVKVTALEVELLEFLMRHPDQIFSSAELFQSVWPSDTESTEQTVRVHVRVLRKKLGLVGRPDFIETVLGSGYIIRSAPANVK